MFIVSEDLLERLNCSQCKKYLSVKPVKVYPNRGIKCGRCSNADDAGVVSLFGVLAEEALFRCVNRFEGCNELLLYSDVAEHEKYCVGKEYDCPCCGEPFKGTAYEIYLHFKEHHSSNLLVNTPEFVLEVENEVFKSYLYRNNDLLFYINARYNVGEEELVLNAAYFGEEKDASKVTQMFKLHSLDGQLRFKTKKKSCCSVSGGNTKSFKIDLLPGEYPKNILVCRFDLNTENVDNVVALPTGVENKKLKYVAANKEPKKEVNTEDGGRIIVKPSAFGDGFYPVNIFNPTTTSQSNWGQPILVNASTPSTNPPVFGAPSSAGGFGTPSAQPIFLTQSQPSVFGSSAHQISFGASNPRPKQTNIFGPSSSSGVFGQLPSKQSSIFGPGSFNTNK